jgi:hypothetical protein
MKLTIPVRGFLPKLGAKLASGWQCAIMPNGWPFLVNQ